MPYKIKEHYIKYNGGYPERNVFCIKGDDTKYIIDYFYSIGCSEGNMLEKVLPLLRDSNVFPEWLVPLADEEGGDIFAYSIKKEDEGAIYYYSHEFEYGENPENYIKFLAKDIEIFLESLDYED